MVLRDASAFKNTAFNFLSKLSVLRLLGPGGRHTVPPVSRVCVQCTSVLKKILDFFVSVNKNRTSQKYRHFIRLGQTSLDKQNISKVFDGSRHPNIMNPSEYGKSFQNRSFPKRIGTLTQTSLMIFGGAQCV